MDTSELGSINEDGSEIVAAAGSTAANPIDADAINYAAFANTPDEAILIEDDENGDEEQA